MKKGSNNKVLFRITDNWKLRIIILLLILFLAFIYFITQKNLKSIPSNTSECRIDSDCSPACGCHPNSCIATISRVNCSKLFCTQECSGPLDCGAGSCKCVQNKCGVVLND